MMHSSEVGRLSVLVLLTLSLLCSPAAAFEPLPRSTPDEHEIDAVALAAAFDSMEDLGYVYGMVVVRDGHVVGEEHWLGPGTTLRDSRSVTKSVISILLGIAIEQGYIGEITEPMVDYLPAHLVPADPAMREITLGNLLTHTSGLQWDEEAEIVAWLTSSTPTEDILDKPVAAAPGTVFNYNTAATHLLSVVITEATGMRTLDFADTYLFEPLGISQRYWILAGDYENGGAGLALRTEDAAKLGVLFIDGGAWHGEQVISKYWVNRTTYPDVNNIGQFGPLTDLHYGWLWWLDHGTDYRAHFAWGWGGQFIFCVPALELVVAVNSPWNVVSERADLQEAAVLDIIVNQILPATSDRRVLTTTGQEVPELVEVDQMMEDLLREHEIQGATAAVVRDGRLVLARGYTLDEPDVQPLEPTALFRIGSTAKSITSVAIHQLLEQGLLSYDTPASSTLDLQPLAGSTADPLLDDVTVDHLLTHTSGMYSENNIYRVGDLVTEATGNEPPPTKAETVSYMIGHPFLFEPGGDWDYNNYAYMTLDMLLENATGEGFVDYLRTKIFRPIGVSRVRQAHMLQSELAPTEVSYDGLEGDPYKSIMEAGAAAGGMVMAAPDMARLLSALFDDPDASGLLTADTRDAMLSLPFPMNQFAGYGRGWYHEQLFSLIEADFGSMSDPDDGFELYGHGSGGSGTEHLAFWRGDNTTVVLFTNTDPVENVFPFPEIDVWPGHDLWQSVGVSPGPATDAATESWIPVVARAEGVGGSEWRSDVGLLNRSTLGNHIRLCFYREEGFRDLELELDAGEYRTVGDVVHELGLEGAGPLRIFSSEPLTVTSRTYNQASNGTFGQFLGGRDSARALETGDSVVLMQLAENEAARTNIGITNGFKRTAEIEVALYDGNGSLVTTLEREIPPEQTVQLNRPFLLQGGRSDVDSGYAEITVLFGSQVLAYASVVDNGTSDPTTMPGKRTPGAATQWIAAAAHAGGANDSQWRTDVAVLNLSGGNAEVELRYHGDEGDDTATTLSVGDGEQLVLDDVVAQLESSGTGSIEVVSTAPVLVSSRTFNLSADGGFGQLLDGLNPSSGAAAGEFRWLPQLQQNDSFRSNIGLLNTGSTEARVRVHLFDATGVELATPPRTLAPGERLQLQEPFDRIAGRSDLDAGYAVVEVRTGSGVHCYASVVDNLSNDPTTVPAVP